MFSTSITWLSVQSPLSETTDGDKFDLVLELIAGMGRVIFKLFQHPSLAIVKAAGLIMKAIIEASQGLEYSQCYCCAKIKNTKFWWCVYNTLCSSEI